MKSKYLILPLLAGIIHVNVFAQPVIKSQRVAGGSGYDEFSRMVLTKDGGLIAGGSSTSYVSGEKTEDNRDDTTDSFIYPTSDYWIVKYDSRHNIQWDKTIGGGFNDQLQSLRQTSDGGYILGGFSSSNKSREKTENNRCGCSSPGYNDRDYWIVKLDSKGNVQWDKTIGGNLDDWLYSIQQTKDGGYILGGWSSSNISGEKSENRRGGSLDYWIVKLDKLGNIQWDKTIGGNDYDYFASLQQTKDGGYILGGYSNSNKSGEKSENKRGDTSANTDNTDYWIVKLNAKGNIQWDKTIGGNSVDELTSIQQTRDSGYVLGGNSNSNISGEKTENSRGWEDYWIVKLNKKGNIQWNKTIGGNSEDRPASLQQTRDDGYILGGWSWSNISGEKTENDRNIERLSHDYWIVKLNRLGKFEWDKTIGGVNEDRCYNVKEISQNHYVAGGWSESNLTGDKKQKSRGAYDYWLVWFNYNPVSNVAEISENIASIKTPGLAFKSFSFYPNPAKDVLHIQTTGKATISLTDASGKAVLAQTVNSKGEMNTSRLKAGVYYLKNHATGEVKKVVVER